MHHHHPPSRHHTPPPPPPPPPSSSLSLHVSSLPWSLPPPRQARISIYVYTRCPFSSSPLLRNEMSSVQCPAKDAGGEEWMETVAVVPILFPTRVLLNARLAQLVRAPPLHRTVRCDPEYGGGRQFDPDIEYCGSRESTASFLA